MENYSELEAAGLLQFFEFSFELGWKTLKDRLFFEGFEDRTPRSVIRRAFVAGFLDAEDTELWLAALEKRNLLSHTYDKVLTDEAVGLIRGKYTPMLRRAIRRLQGSETR